MFTIQFNDLKTKTQENLISYLAPIVLKDFENQTEYTDLNEYMEENLEKKLKQLMESTTDPNRVIFKK